MLSLISKIYSLLCTSRSGAGYFQHWVTTNEGVLRALIAVCSMALGVGCATQASLTVFSQPAGAYISAVSAGTGGGIAPFTFYYDGNALKAYKGSDGCYLVKGFKARWVSGVSAHEQNVRLCGSSTGDYNITIIRDPSAPGFEKDMQFALQVQAILAHQQQAQAAQDAAAAALVGAFSATQQINTPLRCMSYPIGDSVHTTCK